MRGNYSKVENYPKTKSLEWLQPQKWKQSWNTPRTASKAPSTLQHPCDIERKRYHFIFHSIHGQRIAQVSKSWSHLFYTRRKGNSNGTEIFQFWNKQAEALPLLLAFFPFECDVCWRAYKENKLRLKSWKKEKINFWKVRGWWSCEKNTDEKLLLDI